MLPVQPTRSLDGRNLAADREQPQKCAIQYCTGTPYNTALLELEQGTPDGRVGLAEANVSIQVAG
jgi:hypothetical protein